MNGFFENIKLAHDKLTGWCSWEKAQTLAAAVLTVRPKVIVEIGVWGGKSFVPMVMAQRHLGFGMSYAIDPWSPAASVLGQQNDADKEWWGHQDKHDYAYGEFMKNIESLGLCSHIEVIRKASDEVAPQSDIGILHLDGNHGEQTIRDVTRFAPNVIPGGFVFLDDIGWTGGAVEASAAKLKEIGFYELYVVDDSESQNKWAAYQKKC